MFLIVIFLGIEHLNNPLRGLQKKEESMVLRCSLLASAHLKYRRQFLLNVITS